MTIQTRSYIVSFSIPTVFDEERQKMFLRQWQIQHSQDHQNFFSLLESLQNQLNLPAFEMNYFNIWFEPGDTEQINNFLLHNGMHHADFYQWLNSLGAQLPNFGKTAQSFPAMMNPVTKMIKVDVEEFNKFLWQEWKTHNNLVLSINALYTAYGV